MHATAVAIGTAVAYNLIIFRGFGGGSRRRGGCVFGLEQVVNLRLYGPNDVSVTLERKKRMEKRGLLGCGTTTIKDVEKRGVKSWQDNGGDKCEMREEDFRACDRKGKGTTEL